MIRKILSYKGIILKTKPTYWWKYVRYSHTKKKDRTSAYLSVPENLDFTYLSIAAGRLLDVTNYNPVLRRSITSYADEICKEHIHVFDVTTERVLGQWHKDPVTTYAWPLIYYKNVRKLTPQGSVIKNNDIKYPWELSCSHFLVTLAQAFLLTKDKRYADAFFMFLDDWVKANPIGRGVNWCCTLDVALRSVNWIVAASIFHAADTSFDIRFAEYVKHLYAHMLFINDNLEYGFVRENHYLADIVGLKMTAQCFPKDIQAKCIYRNAAKKLKEEITYQVCKDGVDHEASSCYHGFVFELFMVALATDTPLRDSLSRKQKCRLQRMLHFTEELCRFQCYPVVGDNDGERVLDLNGNGTFRCEVVDFGKQVLGVADKGQYNEYSMVIDGNVKPENRLSKACLLKEFKEGGYVLVDNGVVRFLLHCGSIGRKGKGGHGHNDQTSFVMDIRKEAFIIDPGSMVYERDLQLRHDFRSTAMHNCVMAGDMEQNHISINRPFKMDNDTKAYYTSNVKNDEVNITARHKGYERKCHCACTRGFHVTTDKVVVKDQVAGEYIGKLSCLYTFSPDITLHKEDGFIKANRKGKQVATISAEGWETEIIDGKYSPTYGMVNTTTALRLTVQKSDKPIDLGLNIAF